MRYFRGTPKERLERDARVDDKGCVIFAGYLNRDGYGRMRVGQKLECAHRVSYAVNIGPIPDGMQVLHECDNPPCINPKHLFLGTQEENIQDMVAKGRQRGVVGVRHHKAKLNQEKAFEIRWYAAMGRRHKDIAAEYDITRSLVGRVARCEIWKPECHD